MTQQNGPSRFSGLDTQALVDLADNAQGLTMEDATALLIELGERFLSAGMGVIRNEEAQRRAQARKQGTQGGQDHV